MHGAVLSAPAKIVLGSYLLADYPEAGGLWSAFLQFLLGLDALGVEVYWFEVVPASDDPIEDQRLMRLFLRRFARLGFRDRTVVLYGSIPGEEELSFDSVRCYGLRLPRVAEIVSGADAIWSFCGGFPEPMLEPFRRKVLIDTDPGITQLSAREWDLGLGQYDVLTTIGMRIGQPDCKVPTGDFQWHPFRMPVHLPIWPATPDPGPYAPISTVTNLWGGEFPFGDRIVNSHKHDCFFRYLELPHRTGRTFELATNIDEDDDTGDREAFLSNGWRLVDPGRVVGTPRRWREYLRRSRATLECPKAIYRDLRTGAFSDRAAGYLASARPVITEATGFEEVLPTGLGLVTVASAEEAAEAVAEIDGNYTRHQAAARAIADEFFDARKCLTEMLAR